MDDKLILEALREIAKALDRIGNSINNVNARLRALENESPAARDLARLNIKAAKTLEEYHRQTPVNLEDDLFRRTDDNYTA